MSTPVSKMPMDVCIFGGGFDPVHLGHLAIAKAVEGQFRPQRILWAPTYHSPESKAFTAPFHHRLAMVELALSGLSATHQVTGIEENLEKPSYSLKTVRALKQKHPQWEHWGLVVGSDQLRSFKEWHRWESLLREVRLAVYPREGFPCEVPGKWGRAIEGDFLPVASTDVRKELRESKKSGKIPSEVEAYILEQHLYGTGADNF